MDFLHVVNKVSFMNALEKFYIHLETKKKNQINGKSTLGHNKIFDTIITARLQQMLSLTY
jgi:hypothetical protein